MRGDTVLTEVISKEWRRDVFGEHEMGLRIMGDMFAERLYKSLAEAGYKIVKEACDE